MGALVRLDGDGQWQDTWVCDALIKKTLAREGVAWGRWPLRTLSDQGVAGVLEAYADELGALKRRFQARAVDRLQVDSSAAQWPDLRRQLLVEEKHAESEVRIFLDGAGLTTIRTDGGFLALLCEAEEWVLLPAGSRHWFDAGDAPQLDLLRLFSRPVDGVQPSSNERPQALPLFDEFVGTMLELTGHEAD